MPLMKTICPHCHLVSANSQVCTNLGCGKRIAASVQLFARTRRSLPARPPQSLVRRTPSHSHSYVCLLITPKPAIHDPFKPANEVRGSFLYEFSEASGNLSADGENA
jgi:hypothetical protein